MIIYKINIYYLTYYMKVYNIIYSFNNQNMDYL